MSRKIPLSDGSRMYTSSPTCEIGQPAGTPMENPVELVNRWYPAGTALLPPDADADAEADADGLGEARPDGLADGRADADALCDVTGGAARCDPGEPPELSTRPTTAAAATTITAA